jgi:hypothetical protein
MRGRKDVRHAIGARGGKTVDDNTKIRFLARAILLAGLAAITLPVPQASAQNGFFDALFGRRPGAPASASAYADPSTQWSPFGWGRQQEAPRPEERAEPPVETGVVFCVRTCDGRYFPLQRHGNTSAAQVCSSFCPASQTKIYSGGSIDRAVGQDGRPYKELATAFAYRERVVAGCTCNGKDAFGLVTSPVEDDPTLRAGDIVATNNGLMAYSGTTPSSTAQNGPAQNGGNKRQASFTPVGSYSGLSADLRRKLTETQITPAPEAAAPPPSPPVKTAEPVRNTKGKRAQADR